RRDLSVSPRDFEEQLAYLQQEGYESITLNDLALHLTRGKPLPPKPIILTFDDGYANAYTEAFPLLQQYGFAGTFFVISEPVDAGDPNFLS
ncbi:MAG: polysaccharide deacetylase family protein, partial [Anaerolineae bacterium]|nr:polysaccharide deacetylase family protein [Anaerolineae bacterium]